MPEPRTFAGREDLIGALKRYPWRAWFERERRREAESDLKAVIKRAVGGNTFRAFQKLPKRPSVVFRSWALRTLNEGALGSVRKVRTQRDYHRWLADFCERLRKHWKKEMKAEMPYGASWKLPNLVVKRICLFRELSRPVFERLVWFLDVPLDSYTLAAIRGCTHSFAGANHTGPIPKRASMKFVRNLQMYDAIQEGIRGLAADARVPPIALDCLAWNSSHSVAQQ